MSKVLVYVNGIMTVQNGDKKFVGAKPKPSFIKGETLYFEETQKVMDGNTISFGMIDQVNNFIENFDFAEETAKAVDNKYYVNKIGAYIGIVSTSDDDIEVPNPPAYHIPYPFWYEGEFVAGILVNKETNEVVGLGTVDSQPDVECYYAPSSKLLDDQMQQHQIWDPVKKIFTMDFKTYKCIKIEDLKDKYNKIVDTTYPTAEIVPMEEASFTVQEKEARAYLADNNASTPFLDNILVGRGFDGETIEDLANKVVKHADNFYKIGLVIGKYQKAIKEMNAATTFAEADAVDLSL